MTYSVIERLEQYQAKLKGVPFGELCILEEAIRQEYKERGYE
jgi:hypothetical protein